MKDCIEFERSIQIDYGYGDIRKWLSSFRNLDYTQIKNRRYLIDSLIYKIILYDDKMKFILRLNSSQQKDDTLIHFLYPEYDGENDTPENEKETAEAVSNSFGGSTPNTMVERRAIKTHSAESPAILYKINRFEYYCQVELPLSEYALYGKSLAAAR